MNILLKQVLQHKSLPQRNVLVLFIWIENVNEIDVLFIDYFVLDLEFLFK